MNHENCHNCYFITKFNNHWMCGKEINKKPLPKILLCQKYINEKYAVYKKT